MVAVMQRSGLVISAFGALGILGFTSGCGALLGISDVEYRDGGSANDATTPGVDSATPDGWTGSAPPDAPGNPPGIDAGNKDATMPTEASVPLPDGAMLDAADAADARDAADAAPSLPTSCLTAGDGLSNCGSNSESCCTTLEVEGGTVYRSYQSLPDGGAYNEDHPATVSTFFLDKYEITVGRFRQYVQSLVAGGSPPPNGSGIHKHLNGGLGVASDTGGHETGWDATSWDAYVYTGPGAAGTWNADLACDASYQTWTPAVGANERLPITCVNWWQAYAFCIWDGGFLPTEAEWQYAAAGGSDQREYPWGATDPGTSANSYAIFNCNFPSPGGGCSGLSNVAPVGTATMGGGRWGQLDLAGSIWEWNLDWYSNGVFVSPCQDCAYLTATSYRVFPGGGFNDQQQFLLPAIPYVFAAPSNLGNIGARCARSP